MGEPRHVNNVRRVDFAKGQSRSARARQTAVEKHLHHESSDVAGHSGRDRLKVVAMPSRSVARPHRFAGPKQNALLVIIILLAGMLGAVLAALLLNPTL